MTTTVYQVMNGPEATNFFFRHEGKALKFCYARNYEIINQLMKKANRMTGVIRGVNRAAFQEIIGKVANPPYHVKKVTVDITI